MMHMRSGALGRCSGVPWPQHRSFHSLATSCSPPAPARRLRRSSARGQSAPEAPPPTRRVQVSCCGCLCSVVVRGPAATGLCASRGCLLCAVLSGALWAPAGGCGRCRGGRRGAACSAGQPGADPGGHAAPGAHLRGCVRSTRHRARLCPAHRLPSAYGPAACQAGPGPCLNPAPCAAHTDSTGRPSKREVAGAARERPSRPAAPAAAADPGSSGAAETDDGRLLVVEVAAGGNAERAGVRVGDLLRGTTAARTQMEYPTANLMFGGARARAGSLVTRGARLRVAQRSCQAGLPLHLIGQCRGAQAGRPGTGALRARRC